MVTKNCLVLNNKKEMSIFGLDFGAGSKNKGNGASIFGGLESLITKPLGLVDNVFGAANSVVTGIGKTAGGLGDTLAYLPLLIIGGMAISLLYLFKK